MNKKLIVLLTLLAMSAMLFGCGSSPEKADKPKEEPAAEDDAGLQEPIVGGWELAETGQAVELPEEVQAAFDRFADSYEGSDLVPLAYFGRQFDGGMKYMLLCKDEDGLQTVVLKEEAEGTATGADINAFHLEEYTSGEGTDPEELATGSWEVPDDFTEGALPDKAAQAFEKAMADHSESMLTPMACLGTQLVAGTNYAILCRGETTAERSVVTAQLVTVYEDLQGESEMMNIYVLDLAELAGL